jgi:hypothetical protein
LHHKESRSTENPTTRQQKFQAIGKLKPSVSKEGFVNFSSTFIIPIPHNLHKTKNVTKLFVDVDRNWEVKNDTFEKDLWLYDIKKYIKNNMFTAVPKDEKKKKNFILDNKNLYLKRKMNKTVFDLVENATTKAQVAMDSVELWFFTYQISLDAPNNLDVNAISTVLNRNLRNFRSLKIDEKEKKIYAGNSAQGVPFIDYLFSLTSVEGKSFLNIEIESFEREGDLHPIFNSTYYAKMMTAAHIDERSVDIDGEKVRIADVAPNLSETVTIDFGHLEELPYILATTSSFDFACEEAFIGYEEYIYKNIQENGINIWKYWSGIALQDSVAFFSIHAGGAGVVNASKSGYYFLYMLSLYSNIRLKYYEQYLIDEDFINIERIYPLGKDIQKLQNQYMANEVAMKFQPNHIHEKMNQGLKNGALLEEVESNIQTTLELTKQNTDAVISVALYIATFSGMWLSKDVIFEIYAQHPIIMTIVVVMTSFLLALGISRKSFVIKLVKNSAKWLIRKFR